MFKKVFAYFFLKKVGEEDEMIYFEKAKHIWIEHAGSEEYAEFLEEIEYGGGQCELRA